MVNEKLQKAIDALRIDDVYINSSSTYCVAGFDPKRYDFSEVSFQLKHNLVSSERVTENELSTEVETEFYFRILFNVGCRFVTIKTDNNEENSAPYVLSEIEAVIAAEYKLLDSDIENECLEEFVKQNASFYIWPFWREFLMNMCNRMNLPKVTLPAVQLNK